MRHHAAVTLAAILTIACPVAAQSPSGARSSSLTVNAARAGADRGLALFSEGRWAEAYEVFRQADASYHAPTLVLYMAHCQKRVGKLIAARSLYQDVAAERLPPGAPVQFYSAQSVARDELDRLASRIPSLEITLTGASLRGAAMTIDGGPAEVMVRQTLELDPGDHEIEARAAGADPIRKRVTLREGATVAVSLAMYDRPVPAPAIAPARAAPARGSATPGFIAIGVGAALVGAGAVMGAVSLGQASYVKASCSPEGVCPAADRSSAEAAGRLADASTAAFVIGGAAAAAGVVAVIVRPRWLGAAPPVRVAIGLGRVSIEGVLR